MKFAALALAASLVAAAPRVAQVNPSDIKHVKPRKIGTGRIKVPQVHNHKFKQHGKGPRALAKVYRKFDIELPSDLVDVLQQIMQDLGLPVPAKASTGFGSGTHAIGSPFTNETGDQGTLARYITGRVRANTSQARYPRSRSSSTSSTWRPSRSAPHPKP